MHPRHKKIATSAAIALGALGVLAIGGFAFVKAGVYNIGADDPHYRMTYSMLQQLRDASIAHRAAQLTVPVDLMSEARITQGAGNYNAMCTGCHLAPGMESTELSKGLYPQPPNLTLTSVSAAEAFWTIKHGIKASGMPAWGASMGDEYIWNMAAFIQQLPKLDAASYQEMVAHSGGHSHGGGESGEGAHHHHHDGEEADHDHHHDEAGEMPGMPGMEEHHHDAAEPAGHTHPPGTPPHDDAPAAHVDPPGTPPHHHDAAGTPPHSH